MIELLLMSLSLSTDIDELCGILIKLLVDHISRIITSWELGHHWLLLIVDVCLYLSLSALGHGLRTYLRAKGLVVRLFYLLVLRQNQFFQLSFGVREVGFRLNIIIVHCNLVTSVCYYLLQVLK